MRSSRSGFSLIEVVVALFVLGVLVAVGSLSFQSTITRERGKGLAHTLAAELRAARATALQSEKFVAVCFPNDGTNNPFSRSFAVRGGYDRGDLIRTVNFDDDLSATIYTGRWSGDSLETFSELPDWVGDASDEYRLIFRPDGTALSEDIAQLNGKYHFVVASQMEAGGESLTAVTSPTTIWVSKAGTIGVLESTLPTGTLPNSAALPVAARLNPGSPSASENDPVITSVDFLPIKVDGLENVGLGQTAVQIHPHQKRPGMGQNGIEYGLTTFRIRAKDRDGGPLSFQATVEADKGEPGNFSFQETASALGPTTGGQMNFVQTESGEWVWESVISWRPPPGALMGTVYEFNLSVEDPQGNSAEVESGGEILPRLALLQPENLVYETNDQQIIMTNVDGTSHRKLTLDDQKESEPFYSSDGTRLYSFYKTTEELAMITRNADGTNRKKLQSFPLSFFRRITFDPFNNYAAYLTGSTETVEVSYQVEKSRDVTIQVEDGDGNTVDKTVKVYYLDEGTSEMEINKLEVMHLNSGKKVTISNHAQPNFKWYGSPRFGLSYTENVVMDDGDKKNPTPQDPDALEQGVAESLPRYIPHPGFKEVYREVVIRDYPPRPESRDLPDLDPGLESEIFNLARPRYFLEQKSSSPGLTFVDSTGALPKKVVVDPVVQSPSWSGDGKSVLYARESGGTVKICRQQVLNDTLDGFDGSGEEVLYSGSDISQPLLSASGDYAFFLKTGDIMRIGLNEKGTPVNLTENLNRKVLSYVLSP